MSNKPINPDVFEAYLLGQLSDEQVARLEQSLKDDPKALKQLAQAMQVMSLVRQEFAGAAEYRAANQQEPLLQDFNALLKELGEHEAAAEPVSIPVQSAEQNVIDDAGSLSRHDYVAAGGYLLRQAMRSKAVITGLAAAVALFAAVLFVVWSDGSNEPIAEQPPRDDTPMAESIVATLTGGREAVWAEGPPAPASGLRAGQRLTLIEGLAEITTGRGAVAILEAPATIELLDNPNALRLHSGQLVGICETESSKGFVVRTPNMDITDLGTRFGVAIDDTGNTLAEVFEGSVEVSVVGSNADKGFGTQQMKAGDQVVINPAGEHADRSTFAPSAFAALNDYAVVRLAEGIIGLSGQIAVVDKARLLASPDGRLQRRNGAWVSLETDGQTLVKPLITNAHSPGDYTELLKEHAGSIPAGTRIRSYVIGLYPKRSEEQGQIRAKGQVSFRAEVLGVITTEEHWRKLPDALAVDPTLALFPEQSNMIDLLPNNLSAGDTFTLAPDGRTIAFDFIATGGADLLRVIVREDDTPE